MLKYLPTYYSKYQLNCPPFVRRQHPGLGLAPSDTCWVWLMQLSLCPGPELALGLPLLSLCLSSMYFSKPEPQRPDSTPISPPPCHTHPVPPESESFLPPPQPGWLSIMLATSVVLESQPSEAAPISQHPYTQLLTRSWAGEGTDACSSCCIGPSAFLLPSEYRYNAPVGFQHGWLPLSPLPGVPDPQALASLSRSLNINVLTAVTHSQKHQEKGTAPSSCSLTFNIQELQSGILITMRDLH